MMKKEDSVSKATSIFLAEIIIDDPVSHLPKLFDLISSENKHHRRNALTILQEIWSFSSSFLSTKLVPDQHDHNIDQNDRSLSSTSSPPPTILNYSTSKKKKMTQRMTEAKLLNKQLATYLLRYLEESDLQVRKISIELFSKIEPAFIIPKLIVLSTSKNANTRSAALESLLRVILSHSLILLFSLN